MVKLHDIYAKHAESSASARFVTVRSPSAQDGVASALRRSYAPQADTVPDDMLTLLARLDIQ